MPFHMVDYKAPTDEELDENHQILRSKVLKIATSTTDYTQMERQTEILAEGVLAQHKVLTDLFKWMKHNR